jgi:two-component system invasion response regulator UvrY
MEKVLLAEDHSIVIRGIKMIFETEFVQYQLEVTKSIGGLMKMLQTNRYQLAIIDLQLEDGDTMHLITDIRRIYPELRILIFSANPEELYAQRLYKAGIKGYLHKQTEDKEIIAALRMILEAKTYVSERFKNYLLSKDSKIRFDNPFEQLTLRELEVAHLLIKGKRSIDICKDLNIQPSTASTYKMKIFDKLKVTNTLELKELADTYRISS